MKKGNKPGRPTRGTSSTKGIMGYRHPWRRKNEAERRYLEMKEKARETHRTIKNLGPTTGHIYETVQYIWQKEPIKETRMDEELLFEDWD